MINEVDQYDRIVDDNSGQRYHPEQAQDSEFQVHDDMSKRGTDEPEGHDGQYQHRLQVGSELERQ